MEKQQYINITLNIMEEYFDTAYGIIYSYPITGIEEKFDKMIISFELTSWNEELKKALLADLKKLNENISIEKEEVITEKNWNEEWEKTVPAIDISPKIGIAPEWRKKELDREILIIINPKMSFGTGHHATTRLVCRLMEGLVQPGSYWLDVGTGTGALAILAVKLGAGAVYAFDNNSWSIDNARENFERNGVEKIIKLDDSDIQSMKLPECDGIAANLNSNLIIEALPKFYQALKDNSGDLVVSGILKYDGEDVLKAAKEAGFVKAGSLIEDEWVAFHFKPGE